jgi:putative transposase
LSYSLITCDTKLNEYYLNLNYKCHKNINLKNVKNLKKNKKKILGKEKVCSIDPGIRCFLTIYSDNGVSEIGLNITEKINKVCKEIDIIKSKINKKINNKFKYNKRKRKSLNKALHRKIKYVTNIKTELHNKSIKYLTDNYAKIILPHFEIQKMCNIKNKFNNKLAKNLYNISFYKFKMKLVNKCIENDIEFVMCQEYYTSKTCTRCGNIKHDLGCNKIYKCEKCNIIIDRDISAARNIMLRNNNF